MTRKESARIGGLALHEKYDFSGENNPNWRGGISKDNYRYKKLRKQKYPEKVKAGEVVHRAIKSGKLKRCKCEVCGNKNSFAHHDDYLKQLDVKWLCRKHHLEIHGGSFKKSCAEAGEG